MRAWPGSKLMALAVVLATAQLLGCGKDNGTEPKVTTIVGSWNATSLFAPTRPDWGDAITDDGLTVGLTFNNSGGYTMSVTDDYVPDPWICSGTASCSYSGAYSVSGSTIMFDEGTADENAATYSLSGSTLTITFSATAAIADPYKVVLHKR